MARCSHDRSLVWYALRVVVPCLIMALAVVLWIASMSNAHRRPAPPPPEKHTDAEDTMIYMEHLGFRRLERACMYMSAKDGHTMAEADKRCALVFNIRG